MKGSRECCLIPEPGLRRYINKRELGLTEELFSAIDAQTNQPLVARNAERSFERACKVANRETAFFCEIAEPNVAIQILAKELKRSLFLPPCKTAACRTFKLCNSSVSLDEMSAQDQLELIEDERTSLIFHGD